MATLPVQVSPSALGDLREILSYYEEQGVAETGRKITQELLNTAKELADYPQLGRIVPEFDTPNLRELIRPPFRIVYRLEGQRISIIRIWRSERLLHLPEKME